MQTHEKSVLRSDILTQHLLAIDQGTTSSRSIIFADDGSIVAMSQQEFTQHYPKDGWVEHQPEDIWNSVTHTLQDVLQNSGIDAGDIAALGITNQRETTLVWDKYTGETVYPAIVWQDRRTAPYCRELSQNEELVNYITNNTGLLLDPYFSATKLNWILDNVEGARAVRHCLNELHQVTHSDIISMSLLKLKRQIE